MPATEGYPTLAQLIEARAAATPGALFAVDERDTIFTFAEYRHRCHAVACALAQRGVTAGTRVAWILPTSHEALAVAGALSLLGAVQIPLIPILREREVGFILAQTQARHVVTPGIWRGFDYVQMVRDVAPAGVDHLVTEDGELPEMRGEIEFVPSDATAVRWIFYTSGTTANPKGTLHSDATVAAAAHLCNLRFDMVADDREGLVFPVTHIGGISWLMGGLMVGYSHILIESFAPESSIPVLARHGATVLGSGPAFWMAYVAAQRAHGRGKLFSHLRALVGGGAAKPSTIHDEVDEVLGVVLATGYGMTECPALAHSGVYDSEDIRRGDGYALDGVEIKIVRDDGTVAPAGHDGEIRARGPMLFLGYLDPADNADALDREGFYQSGDIGRLDERGVLKVTGRKKDIIIRKGENISAKEVEDALNHHPAIADVAVIALADRERGELCCAVVVLAPGAAAPTLKDLDAFCRAAGLARQKVPERLEIVFALPRNPTGKVIKSELVARFG